MKPICCKVAGFLRKTGLPVSWPYLQRSIISKWERLFLIERVSSTAQCWEKSNSATSWGTAVWLSWIGTCSREFAQTTGLTRTLAGYCPHLLCGSCVEVCGLKWANPFSSLLLVTALVQPASAGPCPCSSSPFPSRRGQGPHWPVCQDRSAHWSPRGMWLHVDGGSVLPADLAWCLCVSIQHSGVRVVSTRVAKSGGSPSQTALHKVPSSSQPSTWLLLFWNFKKCNIQIGSDV